MIGTVIQISIRRLLHNRIELLLTFVVPIAFFSIFALIFGKGIGAGGTPRVKVVLLDTASTPLSERVAESLRTNPGLRFIDRDLPDTMSPDAVSDFVRRGIAAIGIVLKDESDGRLVADLLADTSDQVASQVVSALVGRELSLAQIAATSAVFDSAAQDSADDLRRGAKGSMDPADKTLVRKASHQDAPSKVNALTTAEAIAEGEDAVQIIDIIGQGKSNPVVSMYAAGIAVMFLLFGATGGGGVLLEERENSTLDRLLSTQITMDQLLLGKWFYLTGLGFLQVTVMFIWGQLVFGVDLLGHLDGFVMMTLVTSSAAASFGLFLATLCKTRGQLNGLSVILILTMSALGGSMVPRYVMSQEMQEIGKWTFNAWALDGYNKIFWRDMGAGALCPQLAVLMAAGVGFLLVARALAIRWEFD